MQIKSFAVSLVASAVLVGVSMASAFARDTHTPGIDATQQEIHARIQQGVSSGQITQAEAQALYRREREIHMHEMRIKSDGMATPQEREQLRHDLEQMRAQVEESIFNRRTAGSHTDGGNRIDHAQYLIRSRIEQGMRSGDITRREADILFAKEQRLQRHEAAFQADGYVTRSERQQLRDEVAMLNEDVERMMSNGRRYR
ncbi:hypothetical protein [Noviherbaspirillum saxi]|uniref:Uncharacterized protein n=1 Tax=Noviherbaspirillum saxi TaxID=2320863 RepID=A0A3A3G6J3_9BURK|nr:hypothetical protein [Noviherbaspirillum saxi]RJF95800.1 hypothetical protein D3871_20720 [Noviherbaspirillum saxi]